MKANFCKPLPAEYHGVSHPRRVSGRSSTSQGAQAKQTLVISRMRLRFCLKSVAEIVKRNFATGDWSTWQDWLSWAQTGHSGAMQNNILIREQTERQTPGLRDISTVGKDTDEHAHPAVILCWLATRASITGVSGPSGPKVAKKSQKDSFWGSAKKSPKIPGKVRKHPKKPNFGYF